jgi:hypothetical protein
MVALAIRGTPIPLNVSLYADVRKAIIAATGCAVERAFMDIPDQQFSRRRYCVRYDDSLATRVRERHWERLQAGFERAHGNGWEKARDDVWDALNADALPHGLFAWNDPNDPPRNTPGDNLLTTLFYFVGFATIGDVDAMEQLSNVVRVLPFAIPIGEWRHRSDLWLFVTRPAIQPIR